MKPTFTSAVVKVPAKVGECTCMGTIGWDDLTKPVPWGNSFSFGGAPYPSCINMVAENLEKLVNSGIFMDGAVRIKLYQDLTKPDAYYAIVIDDRIPSKAWLRELRLYIIEPNEDIVADMKKTLEQWEEKRFAKTSFSVPDWCNFWEG